ncbi:hypothetical protein pb186bvf_013929 [Paramecium bursaria]
MLPSMYVLCIYLYYVKKIHEKSNELIQYVSIIKNLIIYYLLFQLVPNELKRVKVSALCCVRIQNQPHQLNYPIRQYFVYYYTDIYSQAGVLGRMYNTIMMTSFPNPYSQQLLDGNKELRMQIKGRIRILF